MRDLVSKDLGIHDLQNHDEEAQDILVHYNYIKRTLN